MINEVEAPGEVSESPTRSLSDSLSLQLSHYIVVSDALHDGSVGYARRVLFSTRVGRAFVMSEQLWQALASGQFTDIPSTQVDVLLREGVLVQRGTNELTEVIGENCEAIRNNEQLYHVIQPTAACQLGCGYCGQSHTAKHLSDVDQEKLLERLDTRLASGRYRSLSIGWFGAEPLVGLSVMRLLSPRLCALAHAHRAAYSAKIVTNGMRLTPQIARELTTLHAIREAEVTLDGPPLIHDARRATKQGGPSFATIFGNLCALRDQMDIDLRIVVRCNVDRHNYASVADLIDLLASADLQRRVSFYLSPVYSWGNDADTNGLSRDEFAAWEVEWLARLYQRGFPAGLLPERRKILCLAVQEEGELTDAYGTVFNCTEVSYVPTYGIPNRYAIGGTGVHAPRDVPFRRFNETILNGEPNWCRTCEMLPVCGGSCPKLWAEGKIPCPSLKNNLRERLALWFAIQKVQAQ